MKSSQPCVVGLAGIALLLVSCAGGTAAASAREPALVVPCEGPEDARITVVAYVGYGSAAARRHEATLRRVLAEHEGSVRSCVRQLPTPAESPLGVLAAYAALEAFAQGGAPAFFRVHRALQGRALDEAAVFTIAREAGLDPDALRASLAARRHDATLAADARALGDLGRRGAPQLFVAGRHLPGARRYAELARVFEDALADVLAQGLLAATTPTEAPSTGLELVDSARAGGRGPRGSVRVRILDVATTGHPRATEPRTQAEARALAERIAAELREGADFGELAGRYGVEPEGARGSEARSIGRGTLAPDVEAVAFSLAVGEVGVSCGPDGIACRVVMRDAP